MYYFLLRILPNFFLEVFIGCCSLLYAARGSTTAALNSQFNLQQLCDFNS